jgi:hypothetical protein
MLSPIHSTATLDKVLEGGLQEMGATTNRYYNEVPRHAAD